MKLRPKLLILNPTCLDVIDAHRDYLNAQPAEWIADPSFRQLRADQVDGLLHEADALILPASLRHLPLSEHMERHQRLRVLSIAASGYDWLDVEAATRCG